MKQSLTYEELMKLAMQYYNRGGDGVYECWDEHMLSDWVSEHGPMTRERARAIFDLYWEDERAADYFGSSY